MLTVRKGCWKGRLFLPTSSLPALPFSPGGETYRRKLRHQETRCELELVEEIYYGQPSTLSLNHTFFLSLLLFSAPIHEEDKILYRRAYHHDLNVCGTPLSFRLFAIPIRENHGRDMDRRNEMRKRAKFLDNRFNLLECNADTSLYNLKIKPCVTTLDAIIFVKKVTQIENMNRNRVEGNFHPFLCCFNARFLSRVIAHTFRGATSNWEDRESVACAYSTRNSRAVHQNIYSARTLLSSPWKIIRLDTACYDRFTAAHKSWTA